MSLTITPDNYLSAEADRVSLSNHQFRQWAECPAAERARMDGTYTPPEEDSESLLVGSYVDCHLLLPDKAEAWDAAHASDIFLSRGTAKGQLRAPFLHAQTMIRRLMRESVARRMLEGDHQWIATGEIAGEPIRIMVDCILPPRKVFVDLKTCRSSSEMLWDDHLRAKMIWYEYWGYWRQMALYREIIRQNHGSDFLPMILAVSREEPPDVLALSFQDDMRLKEEIEEIKKGIEEIRRWRSAKPEEVRRCGRCPYCRETKSLQVVPALNRGMP